MQQSSPSGLDPFWVDLAQIIGAVSTALGVIVALIVAVGGYARQRRAGIRDQASRISVYVESRSSSSTFAMWDEAIVINNSDSPIYDAVVGLGYLSATGPQFTQGNKGNRIAATVPPGTFETGSVAPLVEFEDFEDEHGMPDRRRKPDPNGKRGVTVTFTDSAGRHWERNARGRLTQIKKPPVEARELNEPLPWEDVSRPRT